jgi:hypothetical protein
VLARLTKTGKSLALVLDKRLLDLANIDASTPLEVSGPPQEGRGRGPLSRASGQIAINETCQRLSERGIYGPWTRRTSFDGDCRQDMTQSR